MKPFLEVRSDGRGAASCHVFAVRLTRKPSHWHYHPELELTLVLAGEGTLRLGEERIAVRAGSYAAFPASADLAHQLLNTGSEPLRYLCMSAASDLDVCLYPDTGKTLISKAPWGEGFRRLTEDGAATGYFDGESEDPVG